VEGKMNKKNPLFKIMAWTLTFIIAFCTVPITVNAEGMLEPFIGGEIVAFSPLDSHVAEQIVPHATDISEIYFPDTLMATVRYSTLAVTSPAALSFMPLDTYEKEMPISITWNAVRVFNGYESGEYLFIARIKDDGLLILTMLPVIKVLVMDEQQIGTDITNTYMTHNTISTSLSFWDDNPGIKQVSAGESHSVVIKADGTLWVRGG
jgi:hypothetical protein